ncbi:MAG: hypothetical protein H0V05_16130 [Euzebyaceae bacterium]|nr:hypothetical protein [Euzebyaceae bacterium]
MPVLLWSCWFGAVAIAEGVGGSAELWTGTILWTALLGGALGLLTLPSTATAGSSASPGTGCPPRPDARPRCSACSPSPTA